MPNTNRLPRHVKARLWRRTILYSMISAGASVVLSEVIMLTISHGMDLQGAFAAMVLPLLIGSPTMFVLMLRGEQLRQANQKLEILASTDALTGALNRRSFSASVVEHLARYGHQPAALLLIDVDHFKLVNDRFGHECGDRALELIANTLRSRIGTQGFVGRLGGEEFGILLASCDTQSATVAADGLREAVRSIAFEGSSGTHPLSISIGCVIAMPGAERSFARLYRIADQNLYAAKRLGRDRTVVDDAGSRGTLAA